MAIMGKDLAAHWGCAPSYISKLRREKAMPDFDTLDAADAWRAQLAERPARSEGGKRARRNAQPELPPINWAEVAAAQIDFDGAMIKHAEQVPLMAYALYDQALKAGNDALVAVRIKNWGEASKQAAQVREKFLQIQQSSRTLISFDEVAGVVGVPIQEMVSLVAKLGVRLAHKCNPEQPQLAKQILEAEADRMIAQVRSVMDRVVDQLRRGLELPPHAPEEGPAE
jgi:hypothetical protein